MAMATKFATAFGAEKKAKKGVGEGVQNIPGVNHPVFKNQLVNKDPREVYLSQLFKERGETNVFHDFYSALVQALYDTRRHRQRLLRQHRRGDRGPAPQALVAPLPLGRILREALENAAFTAFLFGRMVGCAGEIDDHINRGRNMDTRTPASQCSFVSCSGDALARNARTTHLTEV